MPETRPILPLAKAQAPFYVGIDLGGTNVKYGLVDDLGRTLAYHTIRTLVPKGPEDGARRIGEGVRKIIRMAGLRPADVARVGLASPGTMDIPGGKLVVPANFPGWDYFPIRDRVAEHAKLPVTFANDATAAAYGEFWIGSGKDFHSLVLLTLGTGIGCGIIIGDLLVDGEHSHGGEFGHTIIDSDDDARICGCGRRGHLEAYASATAVIRRTRDWLEVRRKTSLSERIADGEELTPLMIAEEAEKGDELSNEIIFQTAKYLGIGITNLMHTIDPAGILLGGAMTFGGAKSPLGRRFLDRIRKEVKLRAYAVPAENTTLDFATLGGDAGYLGSAGIARAEYLKLGDKKASSTA